MKFSMSRKSQLLTLIIASIPFITMLPACSPGISEVQPTESSDQLPTETNQPTSIPDVELDLREANVIDVAFERIDDEAFRFDVTLIHDDEGESPSFADSWHVEDLEGNTLGTRVLLHSHGNQPFTRSETFPIPPDVSIVIVRGHDMLHGHGGQSMRVDLNTGEVEAFIED